MPRATLTLTIPDGIWIGDLSREFPDTEIRILAAFADDDAGVGLAEITSPDLAEFVTGMQQHDAVLSLDLLRREDDQALVQFDTNIPLLLLPVRDSGVPLEMPFTLRDGKAVWELTAPQDRLSALADQLDEFGIPYTVDQIQQHVGDEPLLTERQRRLLEAAAEAGYYDTPRRCSLTELAEEVGLAKSTCSETLHRAEEKVVKQFLETSPGPRNAAVAG